MGGRSSSNSSTSSNTNNYSQQLNLEDIDGTAVVGNNNTVTTTDFGAIEAALALSDSVIDDSYQFAAESVGSAFDVVGEATNSAFTFAGENNAAAFNTVDNALESVSQAGDNALVFAGEFGSGAINAVTGAAGSAINAVTGAADNALTFAGEAGSAAFDIAKTGQLLSDKAMVNNIAFANDTIDQAFQFGAGSMTAALGAIEANNIQSYSLANESLAFAGDRSNEANAAFQDAARIASSASESARQDALMFGDSVFGSAIDSIADNAEDTQKLLTDFAGRTIQTAVQSTKSESAQAVDKIINLTSDTQKNLLYLVGGGAALFVLFKVVK